MWRISSAPWLTSKIWSAKSKHDIVAEERGVSYRSNFFHRVRFISTEGFGSCKLHLSVEQVSLSFIVLYLLEKGAKSTNQEQIILDKIFLELLNRQRSITNTLHKVVADMGMPHRFHILATQKVFNEVSTNKFLVKIEQGSGYQ